MENIKKINESVSVGPQPCELDLKELAEIGFKSVVNLRALGEENQPLSPRQEGEKVEALGMQYRHFPVTMQTMAPDAVDRFRHTIAHLPQPVFVHCYRSMRAGALVMIDLAIKSGMTGKQTINKAMQMGFACDQPQLKQFVIDYIDSHSQVPSR